MPSTAFKLCACGCGQPAKLWQSPTTREQKRLIYAEGHYRKDRPKWTPEYESQWRRQWKRKWRKSPRGRQLDRCSLRKYMKANPDKVRDWNKKAVARYLSKPEKLKMRQEYQRRYNQENPQVHALSEQRRRLRKKCNGGTCSYEQWLARCEYYGWCCAYCSDALDQLTATIDHVIPVKHGGTGWPSNLVPACDDCNKKKSTHSWKPCLYHYAKEA